MHEAAGAEGEGGGGEELPELSRAKAGRIVPVAGQLPVSSLNSPRRSHHRLPGGLVVCLTHEVPYKLPAPAPALPFLPLVVKLIHERVPRSEVRVQAPILPVSFLIPQGDRERVGQSGELLLQVISHDVVDPRVEVGGGGIILIAHVQDPDPQTPPPYLQQVAGEHVGAPVPLVVLADSEQGVVYKDAERLVVHELEGKTSSVKNLRDPVDLPVRTRPDYCELLSSSHFLCC
mmetsp:Transcript_12175/g.42358  ORF Transcript_12175/g.42358 Transcript_12175/m.42358 type:complete len:232 (+) Transcript_12175:2003-2698(+)